MPSAATRCGVPLHIANRDLNPGCPPTPRMTWIGKEAVRDLHLRVPLRLLDEVPAQAIAGRDVGHQLIEGDNLEALRALLPRHQGRVKCVTIDPPYNTGNENWVYNDAVNNPAIAARAGCQLEKHGDSTKMIEGLS